MAWSFRFSTLNKKMAPIMQLPQPHLEIGAWLDILDLRQYEGNNVIFLFTLRRKP